MIDNAIEVVHKQGAIQDVQRFVRDFLATGISDPQDRLARLLADLVFGGVDPADCTPADWLAELDPDEIRERADEAQQPGSPVDVDCGTASGAGAAVAGARCA